MAKLSELAEIIRSKNSKSFLLCFDVIFGRAEVYQHVKKSGVINKKLISTLYNTPLNDILITWFDEGYAFKITIPRPIIQADIGDGDMLGGQQYPPLHDVEIP